MFVLRDFEKHGEVVIVYGMGSAEAFVFWENHDPEKLEPSALATHMPTKLKSLTGSVSHSKWL